MYASVGNQIYNWMHYIFAVVLVFIWVPQLMFTSVEGSHSDKWIANFLRMLFFIILTGFFLVVTKLFEVLGIIGVIALWVLLRRNRDHARTNAWAYTVAFIFDFVEFPRSLKQAIQRLLHLMRQGSLTWLARRKREIFTPQALENLLVVLVLATAAYMRLYTAVVNPAPKMSDGDTLLAWIKYIDLRYLMRDGIYPQGFFFYMAVLGKFAVINTLYVLNFTGPLDSVLIVVMMFYFIRKLTKSTIGALVAAVLYGLLGNHLLLGEWMRQAGSETEEFGFFLSFPTIYFFHRFLVEGKRTDFWVAFAGLCDAGLVHPLSYLLSVVGCVSVLLVHVASRFAFVRAKVLMTLAAGVTSGIIALIPYGLAFIYRIPPNQASQSFLQGSVPSAATPGPRVAASHFYLSVSMPSTVDWIAIASIFFLLLIALISRPSARARNIIWLISAAWGLLCYLLYEFGPLFTKSLVLSARMTDLWAIVEAFVIGMAVAALFSLLQNRPWQRWARALGAAGFVSAAMVLSPPAPILPYLVQWNADVNAYLQIESHFKVPGYMIVSPDFESALVLGDGYHMLTGQFLNTYNPSEPPLTRYGQARPDTNIAPYVFVYDYRRIYEVPSSNSVYRLYLPEYRTEYAERVRFHKWLHTYIEANGKDYQVYYGDSDLIVYEFHVKD